MISNLCQNITQFRKTMEVPPNLRIIFHVIGRTINQIVTLFLAKDTQSQCISLVSLTSGHRSACFFFQKKKTFDIEAFQVVTELSTSYVPKSVYNITKYLRTKSLQNLYI